MGRYKEIDINKVRTYSLSQRSSKVNVEQDALPPRPEMSVNDLFKGLPKVLKAEDLKSIARKIREAMERNKPVLVMLGGHVIKTGCAPILIDLMEKGYITHLASNGAVAIHDTELALWGQTSEDVLEQLKDGSFGMVSETAGVLNKSASKAAREELGFGESLGISLSDIKPPFGQRSLLVNAHNISVPFTVHVGIGTDIVHQHPSADGASIGQASMKDFRIFAHTVSRLNNGGVVLNLGCAVIMPEVFLKALSVARNLGSPVTNLTTANFDMIQHYRPLINVVQRPVQDGGNGYSITGHHEIMIPLLAAAIYCL
ncbi:MAG TPA: hypothetical protein VKN82_07840 [Desulfohalobiaceae bacterium]|nr:hypothetical protein [Desulfohalobiaceae bacterium]